MPRLGELLVEKGLVSADGLRSALEACRRNGGRLGTWLVRLGLVSETAVLRVLAEQSGYPPATALDLATAAGDVRGLLPPAFARRNLVVAFDRKGRNLSVAMANPNDLILLDEISSTTGLVVRAHVATEAALTAALALPIATITPREAPLPGPPHGSAREWRQFWRLESAPQELMQAIQGSRPHQAGIEVSQATFPALAPLSGTEPRNSGGLSLDDLVEHLGAVRSRDQAADLVLQFLSARTFRVALFSVHHGKIMGWAARGKNVVLEDFQNLILPLDRPSVFLNLTSAADAHIGPLGGGEAHDLLVEAMGPPPPAAAIIVPVRVRKKTVAFLWLDQGAESVGDISVAPVRHTAETLGIALEVLVLRQKIRHLPPLTADTGAD